MSISGKNRSKKFDDSRIDKLVGELKREIIGGSLWWNDINYGTFGDRAEEIKDYMIRFCRIQIDIKSATGSSFF